MPKNEPISRQAMVNEIEERINANGYRNVELVSELNRLCGYALLLPTIDPVKHGTWLKYPGDIVSDDGLWGETLFDCSVCGHTIHVATEYCAKCGAKMEQDGEIQVRWKDETN